MHLANKTRRNPGSHRCYGDESYVGTVKKAAVLGHKATTSRRVIGIMMQRISFCMIDHQNSSIVKISAFSTEAYQQCLWWS